MQNNEKSNLVSRRLRMGSGWQEHLSERKMTYALSWTQHCTLVENNQEKTKNLLGSNVMS